MKIPYENESFSNKKRERMKVKKEEQKERMNERSNIKRGTEGRKYID